MHDLIVRHRRSGVIVDANLLLLLLIGEWNLARIETFRRTRNHFVADDFARLGEILQPLDGLVTTPHILTEVSNMAGQVEEREKPALYNVFAASLARLAIRDVPINTIITMPEFSRYGLTDAGIIHLAREGTLF